jgi:hypothetical protein
MAGEPLDNTHTELASQVIAACQNSIGQALKQPSQAIGLARGLDAALTSLRLVQAEVAKGESGARAVTANAEALTRHALADVLKLASVPAVAPVATAASAAAAPAASAPPRTNGRLLRHNGASGGEPFHSLRGDAIDSMSGADVQSRTRRLQAGHELGDVHDRYGFRELPAEDCQCLAHLPLPAGIDWSVLKGLNFEAMAAQRRGPGRPGK